jgi:predicted nucleic acid-binding protein
VSGNNFLLDTNIILYLLNGDETLADFLYQRNLYVSFITEMELLSYRKITEKEHASIQNFLQECIVVEMNNTIKETAIAIRKNSKIKLPDSIVAATAIYLKIPLISADNIFEKLPSFQFVKYNF